MAVSRCLGLVSTSFLILTTTTMAAGLGIRGTAGHSFNHVAYSPTVHALARHRTRP